MDFTVLCKASQLKEPFWMRRCFRRPMLTRQNEPNSGVFYAKRVIDREGNAIFMLLGVFAEL
jgi:hypothetical protein